MKVDAFLHDATEQLEASGISTARLDVLVLLEDVLNTNRTQLLAEPDTRLTDEQLDKLRSLIQKRAQHVPLAYLRRKTEFYGREFVVNEHVLVPRPESETMIDIFDTLELPQSVRVADIGCGSGALGLSACLGSKNVTLTLLDIDSDALAVAKENALLHNVDAQCIQNDLLVGLDEQFDVLLCNLPYVPTDFHINTAATHEPSIAIFGGPDGLDLYRRLFAQITDWNVKPLFVLTESLPPQHESLVEIARKSGFRRNREDDFIQVFQPA